MVGDNTPDEMRVSGMKLVHKTRQLFLVSLCNCTEQALLHATLGVVDFIISASTVREQLGDMAVLRGREEPSHTVVKRIFIFLQPTLSRVLDLSCIMRKDKPLTEPSGTIFRRLVIPERMKLVRKRPICGFRHDRVLVQARKDTNGIRDFDQINCGLQVFAEVDKLPLNLLSCIFFLLQNKHVVIEELLQLFVGVVDAQLLEAICLKYLETGDIEDSDEVAILTRDSVSI
ncbi:hypothetical protein BJX62DRAFT_201257 [Aspergillus germanicus]